MLRYRTSASYQRPSLGGFRYQHDIHLFREDSTAQSARYGSGFVIEQLTAPGRVPSPPS
jgi:hypothetical protein